MTLLLAMAFTGEPPSAARPETIKPPAIQKGDTLGLVAPASPSTEPQLRATVANLVERGYRVKVTGQPTGRRGYLAGDDTVRAAALNDLIRDPEVKAIVCLRGGYGSPRILDAVDYATLRRQPKIIVGYSDVTALLLAVRRHAGLVCFHGPMGREWGLNHGLSPYSEKYFWSAFKTQSPLFADWGGDRPAGMKAPVALVDGVAEGVLVGGNLSLISSLMGTPYEIDTRDAVLFLEEVSEKPFRIDRMLNQLRLAGKFKQLRGVLLGSFRDCDAREPEGDLSPAELFVDYFVGLGVPVLCGFPAGHVPQDQATLPLGVRVRLDAKAGMLTILEPPVAPAAATEEAVEPRRPNGAR